MWRLLASRVMRLIDNMKFSYLALSAEKSIHYQVSEMVCRGLAFVSDYVKHFP
jgi:hypothetical protein